MTALCPAPILYKAEFIMPPATVKVSLNFLMDSTIWQPWSILLHPLTLAFALTVTWFIQPHKHILRSLLELLLFHLILDLVLSMLSPLLWHHHLALTCYFIYQHAFCLIEPAPLFIFFPSSWCYFDAILQFSSFIDNIDTRNGKS